MTPVNPQTDSESAVLLGIESSGITCAAGVSKNNLLLAEVSANIRNIHSQKLSPFTQQILDIAGLIAPDIDAIILSAGPGSFTGLRIGYSVSKGLAHALNIPIIEISTLDVWAYQAGPQTMPVVSVIDAHRGEIFCAMYNWQNGEIDKEKEAALIAPDMLKKIVKKRAVLTGIDADRLFPKIEAFLPSQSTVLKPAPEFPQMWALLQLGFQKFQQKEFSNVNDCEPMYLRTFKGAS